MNTTAKTKKTEAELSEDVDTLSADLAMVRTDIATLVDTVGRLGRSRAQGLANSASAKASEGIARGEAALTDVADELRSIEGEILASTRSNPWRALGIAAVVGFIAGVLFRR